MPKYYPSHTSLASQITGTSTNDSAATGYLGEFVTATVATPGAGITSATPANVTSISLTAGDWDLSGVVDFILTAATSSEFRVGISLSTGTLPTQAGGSGLGTDPLVINPLISTLLSDTVSVGVWPVRLSIAATTTVYLVQQATFSAGTMTAFGTIRARRAR